MISCLKGQCLEILKESIILDIDGIGFQIYTLKPNKYKIGDTIVFKIFELFTENSYSLYGFEDSDTLNAFEELLRIKGVGPKTASNILEKLSLSELCSAVENEDYDFFKGIKGLSYRLIDEIIAKFRFKRFSYENLPILNEEKYIEARSALKSLGYNNDEIFSGLSKVDAQNLSSEEIVRAFLMLDC